MFERCIYVFRTERMLIKENIKNNIKYGKYLTELKKINFSQLSAFFCHLGTQL